MMIARISNGIELLPDNGPAKQLFILLHGAGGMPSDLLPLAYRFKSAFPAAAYLLPEGDARFDGGSSGRQWYSINDLTERNLRARVAEAIPALHALVKKAQDRFKVLQSDTALIGFSQGAIMALEYSLVHDGGVGRVIAFSGRFATMPEKAPELTTLHLLHGEEDGVMPVSNAYDAYARLTELQGDATLDVASSVGHELHNVLADRAISRLQTCIPLRIWKHALNMS